MRLFAAFFGEFLVWSLPTTAPVYGGSPCDDKGPSGFSLLLVEVTTLSPDFFSSGFLTRLRVESHCKLKYSSLISFFFTTGSPVPPFCTHNSSRYQHLDSPSGIFLG